MDIQIAKRMGLSGELDSLFAQQKAEKKRFDALPTLRYYFTIMSDDQDLFDEGHEDPCQKYSQRGWGKTEELAKADSIRRFRSQWGNTLEIYWIKCHGLID